MSFRPSKGSQQERLLLALLSGVTVDPVTAITEYDILIPGARAAELRRMGWPVRSIQVDHPGKRFLGKTITAYIFDNHFRHWFGLAENKGKHPGEYKQGDDGRGKFAGWKPADFEKGERSNVG